MDETSGPLSVVLFSGTDDRLTAAAVLAVGAAAMGRPVNVFLQYYALDAFRADRIRNDHGLSSDASAGQAPAVRAHRGQHWSELFAQAKDLGGVRIDACALSMEIFGLTQADLDPLVDGVEGVAAFMGDNNGGMVFI